MPMGKVWICYYLCFFCVCVCTVKNFSGADKASGVKFCTVVHRRPGQGISYFGKLCSFRLEAKIGQIGARRQVLPIDNSSSTDGERGGTPGHALGIGRYTAVPEDGRICLSFGCKRSSYCYAMLPHAQRGL